MRKFVLLLFQLFFLVDTKGELSPECTMRYHSLKFIKKRSPFSINSSVASVAIIKHKNELILQFYVTQTNYSVCRKEKMVAILETAKIAARRDLLRECHHSHRGYGEPLVCDCGTVRSPFTED